MSKHHVLTPSLHEQYPVIIGSDSVSVIDAQGKRYMDMSACPFASSLGYGREDMAEAIRSQAVSYHSAYRKFCFGDVVERAADLLHEMSGLEKFVIVSGGSEANEMAAKIARIYHVGKGNKEKSIVLGRWCSYHGGTMYTMSLAGDIGARAPYLDTIEEKGHIPPCYCYRCWFDKTSETCSCECAQALEREILRIGPEKIAAFICETVSGSALAAAAPPDSRYFEIIKAICKKYDVLLIMDEVLAGSGRTGKFMAAQHYGITPDIATFGKCVSGAYIPAAAVGCSKEVVDAIAAAYPGVAFPIIYTCANQPMNAAVIAKTLEIFKNESLIERNREIGSYLMKKLKEIAKQHPTVGDVRGLGSLIGIEYVANKQTKALLDPDFSFGARLMHELEAQGVLLLHFGQITYKKLAENEEIKARFADYDLEKMCIGDLALLAPPFTLTRQEADVFLKRYDSALTKIEKEYGF